MLSSLNLKRALKWTRFCSDDLKNDYLLSLRSSPSMKVIRHSV